MQTEEGKQLFVEAIYKANVALYNIVTAYEGLSPEENAKTAINYPFTSSFDEWCYEYDIWCETVKSKFFPEKEYYPTITVKEMRDILNVLPDDDQITIQTEGWWMNIKTVLKPTEDNGLSSLVLVPNDNFDTRQF